MGRVIFLVGHELKNGQPEAFWFKNFKFNRQKNRTGKIWTIGPKFYLFFLKRYATNVCRNAGLLCRYWHYLVTRPLLFKIFDTGK